MEYFRRHVDRVAAQALADVETLEDWQRVRPRLRRQMLQMLGLWPLPEKINLCKYRADEGGGFAKHIDITADDMTRKLSVSIPLNDPADVIEVLPHVGGALAFGASIHALR